MQQTKFGSMN